MHLHERMPVSWWRRSRAGCFSGTGHRPYAGNIDDLMCAGTAVQRFFGKDLSVCHCWGAMHTS